MRMPEPRLQRRCAACEEEKEKLQRQAGGQAAETPETVPPVVHEVPSGPGEPLDPAARGFFEPRFGQDFSGVRIHSDPRAAESARSVSAVAYTLGTNIVFAAGQYAPRTRGGQRLLAHELTHVIQQSAASPALVRRTFRPDELMDTSGAARGSNPVAANPDTYFHPGSVGGRPGRRALVIAGIHGGERSARELGREVESQLSSAVRTPYFHTVVVPQVNPVPTASRGAGRGATRVADLNREFGTGYTSPSPYARRITSLVNEFDPERILSVHAISSATLGGIFLDPIHARLPPRPGESRRGVDIRSYPAVGTPAERETAFTGDPANLEAMHLTERMIGVVRPGTPTPDPTGGNRPTPSRPASRYPSSAGTASPYSLIYPLQGSMSGGVSLGTWASGHGKTVVTIEIPGYGAARSVWGGYLPSVWEFLRQPPAGTPGAGGTTTTGGTEVQRMSVRIARRTEGRIQRNRITSADLRRQRNATLDRFMRRVYDYQVDIWRARGVSYVGSIAARERMTLSAGDVLPGRSVSLDRDVASSHLLPLLAAARSDLAGARAAGVSNARNITGIRVRSGYRPAREQLGIWEREYPRYYGDFRAHHRTPPGEEFGDQAARDFAAYINERVFSPGYSPHQRARAVDLTYERNGVWATADSDPANIASWRASWLFSWLQGNAARFGFVQNPDLNEPWHWEYRPGLALLIRFLRWLAEILRRFFGLEAPAQGSGSASPTG